MNSRGLRVMYFLSFFVIASAMSCQKTEEPPKPDPTMNTAIPTQGNSWYLRNPGTALQQVFNIGDQNWTDSGLILRTWFRLERPGEVHIGLRVKVVNGTSVIKASFAGEEKDLELTGQEYKTVYVDTYNITKAGYYYVDLKGVSKESLNYAEVGDIMLGGSATAGGVHYINEDYYYWGRRGPSVHLSYEVPQAAASIKYYYNEMTITEGNDVIGSYFMANGFSQGYFGIQVNSATERRVLFSIWSPYQTDNPGEIPPEYRVVLLRKGDEVVAQEFGNEGSGGQSFLRYNWITGNTYRFLVKIEPAGDNKTDYTAWLFPPELGEWKLIASWRRPFTNTFATGLHSFLENFNTRTGPLGREVYYNNQWAYDINGQWHELTRARFTVDQTGRDKARLDFAGGIKSDEHGFFLKNCGFFDETTSPDIHFNRTPKFVSPAIDFESLP
jgi:hypothetical protein